MNLSIEPVAEPHFEGLRRALDTVAREKRFLAFTQAPPEADCRVFYAAIVANGWCQRVALLDGAVVGWCDVLPATARRDRMSARSASGWSPRRAIAGSARS